MIERLQLQSAIRQSLDDFRVVSILGPRQCGKTTVARQIAAERGAPYFDLERPDVQQRLQNPLLELEPLRGLAVIDEVQTMPGIYSVLRGLADRESKPCRFLLLGSASPELVKGSAESLAGRVGFVDMGPFTMQELGAQHWRTHWLRGGFPLSYLAASDAASFAWRAAFVDTFVERDLRSLGLNMAPLQVRRFWTMVAHYHGQAWNGSEVAASMGFSQQTARRYVDILTHAFMLRQLPPWFENAGKRVVKSPKVYVRDSGLLHALLGLEDYEMVAGHPKLGASFEGYCIESIVRQVGERNAWFWGTYGGAELDLLLTVGGKKWGFEFKWTDRPATTKSMHTAMEDLALERLFVVHPGTEEFRLTEKILAVPVQRIGAVKALMAT
jgi:predicted AAA+ superfamily ATPase